MAYGTPRSIDEVAPYFTDIRGGRRPSDEDLRNLEERYRAVGGRTPLVEITEQQAKGVERLLRDAGVAVRTYVGMKHWHPFIREAISAIAKEGTAHLVAVPLAPFYSAMSTGGYEKAVQEGLAGTNLRATFVREWHDDLRFVESWRASLAEAIAAKSLGPRNHVLFTAHSLPKARMPPGDPYEGQLRALAANLAGSLALPNWSFAFQSVGLAGGAWLGPEVHDEVARIAANGATELLVAPIGFVADNLETLYDLDLEVAAFAAKKGLAFRRTSAPNTRPDFLAALAHVVKAHL